MAQFFRLADELDRKSYGTLRVMGLYLPLTNIILVTNQLSINMSVSRLNGSVQKNPVTGKGG